MSDSSQGDGWWMAAPGKWYPPHLRPDVWADEAEATRAWTPVRPTLRAPSAGSEGEERGVVPAAESPRHRTAWSRSRWFLVLSVLVVIGGAAAGTTLSLSGGRHPVTAKPPATTRPASADQLLERAAAALEAARSVRVVAVVPEPGGSILTSNFTYLANGDISGRASVASGGGAPLTVAFREIGAEDYFFGPEAMWVSDGYSARVARALAGRWVVAPLGAIKDVVTFSLPELSNILTGLSGEQPTIGADRSILGVKSTALHTGVGTLWISSAASSRPVELMESDGSGVIRFVDWDAAATIRAPHAVRLPPA